VLTILLGVGSGYSSLMVAHELIHRPSRRVRWIGRGLLTTLLYDHFFTEHLRGHHARVGTKEDVITAKFGEAFWPYLRRSWPGEWRSAWELEARRIGAGGFAYRRWLRNAVARGMMAEAVLVLVVALVAGVAGVVVFVVQAALAQTLTMAVNYFEHWGLERRAGSKATAADAWQSDSLVGQFALLGLGRHADHHVRAARPYAELQWHDVSPRLPRGFLEMIGLVVFRNDLARQLLSEELRRKPAATRGDHEIAA
jgi:alkane 1-monooxygenase